MMNGVSQPAKQSDVPVIITENLTKVYGGADFRAVDELNLRSAPARSSGCSARTARARPPPPACSPPG